MSKSIECAHEPILTADGKCSPACKLRAVYDRYCPYRIKVLKLHRLDSGKFAWGFYKWHAYLTPHHGYYGTASSRELALRDAGDLVGGLDDWCADPSNTPCRAYFYPCDLMEE